MSRASGAGCEADAFMNGAAELWLQRALWLQRELWLQRGYHSKGAPAYTGAPSLFSYEGGDSEFINYLKYILPKKCVQSVSIL